VRSVAYGNGVWIAGTYPDAQLWKSTDGGETWTLKKDLSNETPSQTYVFSVVYGNGVWIAGTDPDAQLWTDVGSSILGDLSYDSVLVGFELPRGTNVVRIHGHAAGDNGLVTITWWDWFLSV